MIAKNHVSLKLLLGGWFVQDLFYEGGPDLVAAGKNTMIRIKVRYATKGDAGYVFSVGGQQESTFHGLVGGCEYLVLVCLDDGLQAAGFYVFPASDAPKAKTLFHPTKGPFPKYAEFYDGWNLVQWK
ncbi:MAG: hypothetical protein HY516_02900 [Candidatus Aenigmarchaeota archaeon]|nr:hypothetical protein [Candidatus Aenigmarchaeota archaeon]